MKILLLSLSLIFTACSGGGGNGNGAPGFTHNQLAEKFVQELNLDADFSVTLVKKSTLQDNFLVIYDPYTDSYDALNIDNYDPALDNAADYYYNNSARGFFDLDVLPGHYEVDYRWVTNYDSNGNSYSEYEPYEVWIPTRYRDRAADITFEKVSATSKDLAKVVALKEAATIQKSAEFLSSEFGLSLDRSKERAGLQAHWKKASKKSMTNAEVDAFSTELLGFSLTSGIQAYNASANGNESQLENLIQQSAEVNSITPEHAQSLMSKVFGL